MLAIPNQFSIKRSDQTREYRTSYLELARKQKLDLFQKLKRGQVQFSQQELRIFFKLWQENHSDFVFRSDDYLPKLLTHYTELKTFYCDNQGVDLQLFMRIYFLAPQKIMLPGEKSAIRLSSEHLTANLCLERFPKVFRAVELTNETILKPGDVVVGLHIDKASASGMKFLSELRTIYARAKEMIRHQMPNIKTLFVYSSLLSPKLEAIITKKTGLRQINPLQLFNSDLEYEIYCRVSAIRFPETEGRKPGFWYEPL